MTLVFVGAGDGLDAGANVRDWDGARDGAGDGARVGMDCTFRDPRITTVHGVRYIIYQDGSAVFYILLSRGSYWLIDRWL
jgi:hypothetical protein